MNMKKRYIQTKSTLNVREVVVGESIEDKVRRIENNKEPITDGAPLVYTERKDGVQEAYDVRTDKWEVALNAMDAVTKSKLAKRKEQLKDIDKVVKDKDGETESIEATK